jgi:hypothetical protein
MAGPAEQEGGESFEEQIPVNEGLVVEVTIDGLVIEIQADL